MGLLSIKIGMQHANISYWTCLFTQMKQSIEMDMQVLPTVSTEVTHGLVPLGKTVEIYDAEILGALEGLKATQGHPMAKYDIDLKILLDNEKAALFLQTGIATPNSSRQIIEFQAP